MSAQIYGTSPQGAKKRADSNERPMFGLTADCLEEVNQTVKVVAVRLRSIIKENADFYETMDACKVLISLLQTLNGEP